MKDNKLTLVIVIVAIIGLYLIVSEFTNLFGKSEKEKQQKLDEILVLIDRTRRG